MTSQQTLSHYLNNLGGAAGFANLGLHEARPVALAGLLEFYASGVKDKNVLLHWNPLWLTSPRAELLDPDLTTFNHQRLFPQFSPNVPCYKEEVSPRLGVLVERHIPFISWATHLQQAYYDQTDIPAWTLAHPYDNPVKPLFQGPSSQDDVSPKDAISWTKKKGIKLEDYPWGDLEKSLQWQFFRRVIALLQERGNRVFVLLGPFNEHMLTPASLEKYHTIKTGVEAWLKENEVAYAAPPPLPSDEYVDPSHPLAAGYERLARWLYPRLPR